MKKYLYIAGLFSFILCLGLVVSSCGAGSSPTKVVKQLHAAIEKGDSKKVGELMTSDAAEMMVMMGDKAKGMLASYGSITNTRETINGDTATVVVTYQNGETNDFELIKVDGKWRVTEDK